MADTSIGKGTAIAAGIGAGLGAVNNFAKQKYVIKNAAMYKDGLAFADEFFKETAKNAGKGFKGTIVKKYFEVAQKNVKDLLNVVTSKKVSGKLIGKAAAAGAIAFGGIYLAYRGIKALFTKNED